MIKFKEVSYRERDYKREMINNKILEVNPLKHEFIINKSLELNNKEFRSELAFEEWCSSFQFKENIFLRKNYPILNRYFGDFVCLEHSFLIEIDGEYHKKPSQIEYDLKRDKYIKSIGWKVFRISYSKCNGLFAVDSGLNELKEFLNNNVLLMRPSWHRLIKINKRKRVKKNKVTPVNLIRLTKSNRKSFRKIPIDQDLVSKQLETFKITKLDSVKEIIPYVDSSEQKPKKTQVVIIRKKAI